MKHITTLKCLKREEILKIFKLADEIKLGKYENFLKGKTIVMFFPSSSIRTRVSFEKGIYLLGGQSVLFPSETLDKKEEIKDVIGYLNNWADSVIVRHNNIELIKEMSKYSKKPVINAMTSVDHPCEIISDLYSLSKIRSNFLEEKYLFMGANGNIGNTWKEASEIMGFQFEQCCPKGYEIKDADVVYNPINAFVDKDIICTDSIKEKHLKDFKEYIITLDLMKITNEGSKLNPCPPFFRGEEVSEEVINSPYFVGYEFKKALLEIQQAIILYSIL